MGDWVNLVLLALFAVAMSGRLQALLLRLVFGARHRFGR